MPIEINIVWEGDAPGLQEHRLSIGAFGDALNVLLLALRRIATNIVGEAVEGDGAEVGRFAKAARQLDIEIRSIVGGSAGFSGWVSLHTPPGENMQLFNSLPQTAGMMLLDAVESESKGIWKNSAVRRYLKALPPGVYRQTYVLHDNGTELKRVAFGQMEISTLAPEVPYLVEVKGRVVGVGFEPGRNEVRLKTEDGKHFIFIASAIHVEGALEARGSVVKAIALIQENSSRLLRIQEAARAWSIPSRESAIFDKWNGLLTRLAQ
jgi:hypothetical protein